MRVHLFCTAYTQSRCDMSGTVDHDPLSTWILLWFRPSALIFNFTVLTNAHVHFLCLLTFFPSFPPLSLFVIPLCSQMSVHCYARARVCWEIEKTEEGLWALWVPVVAALPPLFLPSSLFLSPHRQLWIWHLNKYESALFFPLSVRGFTLLHKQQRRRKALCCFSAEHRGKVPQFCSKLAMK